MDTPDASILLEQNDFLRRLARGLTRDEAAADDLAQETWLQTLRRPPAEGDPGRGWLATVARNVARNQGRSERRRQDREARIAVHGEATVDERAEQLVSLQGDVAAALGRLSEPLRTAIVLRYYEDRAPAAIAEELGVPVETVRTRLKRGLAKLREDLDRRHGGDRAAWSLPLAGLAEVGARTAVAGTAAGVGWMAVVASLVVAAGAVVVAMIVADPSPGGTGPALDVEVAASSQPAAALGTSMPEETPGGTAEAVADTVQERTPIPPASTEDGAVVRGRVLDTNDAPVANALVELRALPSNQGPTTMESARDAAERLILLEARTSGDGRFEFRVPVESDHVGVLRANHPLHITAAWPLVALSKGADVDVGDAQLVPGGAVRVRLTNGEGEPLAESSWSVRADSNAQVPGRPRSGYSATAEVDAATGIALVDGLPVGPVEIAVSSPLFKGRIEGRAEVVLGEEVALDLAHDGPSAATRLAVEFRGRMVAAQPASETVRLDATDGPRAPVEHRGFGPFLFTDLEPGSYRVESTDPRFRPWSAVLETGRVHRVELIGAASARFVVRDAKTGEELKPLALTLELTNAKFKPSTVVALARGGAFPASGVVDDLVAGPYAYELETEEYGTKRGRIEDLTAGPTRLVEIVLGEDKKGLVGRVVAGADRTPVVGADVHVTAGDRAGHLMGPRGSMMDQRGVVPPVDHSTKTDADGRFRFPSITAGVHTLRVLRGPWFQEDRTLTVDPGSGDEVLFELSEGATVRGVVRVPEGFDPTGIAFEATETGNDDYDPAFGAMGLLRVRLDDAGRFEVGPLRPGVWTLGFGLAGEDVKVPRRGMTLPGSYSRFYDEDVTVIDGRDSEITVDLRQRIPSKVRVDLSGGDVRPSDVRAWTWDLDTNRLRGQRSFSATGGGRSSGADDALDLGAVRPGRYRIVLVSDDGLWAHVEPEEVRIGVAQPRTLKIGVTLERRTIEFRDAETDAPLGGAEVAWSLGLPESRMLTRRKKPWTTDAKGRCEVTFPKSSIEVTADGYAPTTLSWPTPEGDPQVVRLQKR